MMKNEVPHRKGDQRSRRKDVNLEARKQKRKRIRDILLHADLMTILMRVKTEAVRARKVQIPGLGWFLRRISTNTAYLQIWYNTPMLMLILTSKRQT